MYQPSLNSLLSSALWVASCSAITLFAAHSDGNVTSLSLTGSGDSYNLSVASVTTECEGNPSWLTLDNANRVLYCVDRGASGATAGSLNSFSIGANGALSRLARVSAPLSGVSGEIFTTKSGAKGYATASYNRSAVAVYELGKNGALTGPLQSFLPTINKTGPVISRQDNSYLHQVLIDPEQRFVVMNDLGGDQVRLYKADLGSATPLVEQKGLTTDAGSGPRHGVFWKSPSGDLFYFYNGELDQKVHSYRIKYSNSQIRWTKVFDIPALGEDNAQPATTAPTSEIALSPDNRFIIVSHRDISFRDSLKFRSGPTDTISTFKINDDGTLTLVQLAPSGGYSPRQFAINKAGDLLAIGHQNNRTVVIWKRDVESGKIVPEASGGKLAVVTLTGAVVCTIFDE